MAVVADYPDGVGTAGPTIANLNVIPIDYQPEIERNEDGGVEINVQPCGLRKWELSYEGLSYADFELIRTHINLAKGRVNEFDFYSREEAFTHSGVQYFSVEVPQHQKHWSKGLRVTLCKFI